MFKIIYTMTNPNHPAIIMVVYSVRVEKKETYFLVYCAEYPIYGWKWIKASECKPYEGILK